MDLLEYYALTEKIQYPQIFWLLCYNGYKSSEKSKQNLISKLLEGGISGITTLLVVYTKKIFWPLISLAVPFIISQVNGKIVSGKSFDSYKTHIMDLKKEDRINLPDYLFDDTMGAGLL